MNTKWRASDGTKEVFAPARSLAILTALAMASTNPNYRWPQAERDGWYVEQIDGVASIETEYCKEHRHGK